MQSKKALVNRELQNGEQVRSCGLRRDKSPRPRVSAQRVARARDGGITAHLANCENCERQYDIEVVFNQVIQHSCDEAPPPELAQRVLNRLREIQNHE